MEQNKRKLILLVDEPDSRRELKLTMESWGYSVRTANCGSEALSVFKNEAPSIVITVAGMPLHGGLDMLRFLKGESPDAAVVVVSACADFSAAIAAMKEGAADFLTKPVDYLRLKSLLEALP